MEFVTLATGTKLIDGPHVRRLVGLLPRLGCTAVAIALLAATSCAASGQAQQRGPHLIRLEGAAAVSLDDDHAVGGGFGVGYEYRLLDALGITGSFAGYFFPDERPGAADGTATYRGLTGRAREVGVDGVTYSGTKFRYYGLGGGLRLHALPASSAVDLWLDTGLKFVWIRELSRVGIDVGLGADFILGGGRFAVGPFVRYAQVIQPAGSASTSDDDRFLQLGAALSWGPTSAPATDPVPAPEPARAPEPAPEQEPTDSDGDGVYDADDRCPAAPEDVDGFEDADGCPELDNDGDGTPDAQDDCRDIAGVAEEHGCPAKPAELETMTTKTVELPTRVAFAYGDKTVTPSGARKLRDVLEALKSKDGIRMVRVVGHADDRGSAEVNQTLSEARAQAVVDWLVARGVAAERLEAVGRGASEPRAEGHSEAARRENRRVEFVVTEPVGSQVPASSGP